MFPSSLSALLKGFALALLAVILFPLLPDVGGISAYNRIFPGRQRLPFGENPSQAYNLSIYNLDAMFASHEIAMSKADNEYRIIVIGDSSVWGTLLRPEETLSGQLNAAAPTYCSKTARFYNLGYPTISVTKDLMLLDYALRYQPDAIIWLTTLEALPLNKQLTTPLVANNALVMESLIARYDLSLNPRDPALVRSTYFESTLVGQRRALADIFRLQLYGITWAATGIDQFYSTDYSPPKMDFAANDNKFHDLRQPLNENFLAYNIIAAGIESSPVPVFLVNEPMLVSDGENSHIRYNFFYPRWAFDTYRTQLAQKAMEHRWTYIDLWDVLAPEQFTNSAIHLTPDGVSILATKIKQFIHITCE
jgi:hypothetical protein